MIKHKYTVGQNSKYFLSIILSLCQVFTKKYQRPRGISVMIRVRNEEDWIASSLIGLNEFADEVVVVNNNSTDDTMKQIDRVRPSLRYKLKVENEESNDICRVSNRALSLTSYRWIMRWDADFIAYTSGERRIANLRKCLLSLNQKRYYLIFPLTLNFAGDLFHLKKGKETHSEGYIHTWHPKLRYEKKGKFEVLKVPFYFKIKWINTIHFVHIGSAKPLRKILYRFFWLYWQDYLSKFSTIDDFIKYKSLKEWGGMKPELIAINEFKRLILPLRKYDKNEFGDYPELMRDKLKTPDFTMIYKDGEAITRSDFGGYIKKGEN